MCLFNSIRATLLMWLIMPLVIIAVTTGLLLTGMPFGFMALLGVLALGGELIKGQIVVLSKIRTEIDQGKTPYQAIMDGGTSKMRPVCMVVLTTVLGSIPLLTDPFFGAMAVCIIFGLVFAAVLALIVMPVLYAIFFGVRETAAAVPGAQPMRQSVEVKSRSSHVARALALSMTRVDGATIGVRNEDAVGDADAHQHQPRGDPDIDRHARRRDVLSAATAGYQPWAVFSSDTFPAICSAVRLASASMDARSSRRTPTPEEIIAEVATVPATAPPATKNPAPGSLEPVATVSNCLTGFHPSAVTWKTRTCVRSSVAPTPNPITNRFSRDPSSMRTKSPSITRSFTSGRAAPATRSAGRPSARMSSTSLVARLSATASASRSGCSCDKYSVALALLAG